MSKIYCGIDDIPKGYRRGTMKECADKGQVRYYGIKQIDSRLVASINAKKNPPKVDELKVLGDKQAALFGRIQKLLKEIKAIDDKQSNKKEDKDKRDELKAKALKTREELQTINKKIENLKKKEKITHKSEKKKSKKVKRIKKKKSKKIKKIKKKKV